MITYWCDKEVIIALWRLSLGICMCIADGFWYVDTRHEF